jgi:hypothetical protein
MVALGMLQTFERLVREHASHELHVALLGEALQLRRAALATLPDPVDRSAVDTAFARVLDGVRPQARTIYHTELAAA